MAVRFDMFVMLTLYRQCVTLLLIERANFQRRRLHHDSLNDTCQTSVVVIIRLRSIVLVDGDCAIR